MAGNQWERGERRYSREHLWVTRDEQMTTIGVTHYISMQIGKPHVYILSEPGTSMSEGEGFGAIEAAKVVCELTAPISGTIIEVNSLLRTNPTAIVDRPYEVWLLRLTTTGDEEFNRLLSRQSYNEYLRSGNISHPLTRRFSPPER